MKEYPIGTAVWQNYLVPSGFFAPHAQTRIINFKGEREKLPSLTDPCFTCIFTILEHII